jgi:hypothetical protein
MRPHKFIVTVALLATSLSAISAQDLPPSPPGLSTPVPTVPNSVTLRYKYIQGQTLHYKIATDTNGTMSMGGASDTSMPLKQHMDMVMTKAVKSVDATTGAGTLSAGLDSMAMTMNGQPISLPDAQLAKIKNLGTFVISPLGKVISMHLATAVPSGMPMSGTGDMQSIVFPDHAIKVGDTWKNEAGTGMAGIKIMATSTLTGIDVVNGQTVAKVHTIMQGVINSMGAGGAPKGMKMAGNLIGVNDTQFDVNNGNALSQAGSADIKMTMTMPSPAAKGKIAKKKTAAQPNQMHMKMHVTSDIQIVTDAPDTTKTQ